MGCYQQLAASGAIEVVKPVSQKLAERSMQLLEDVYDLNATRVGGFPQTSLLLQRQSVLSGSGRPVRVCS